MAQQRPHLLRIYKKWKNKEEFDEILGILRQYPAGIERVSLFTGDVHTPLTLEETRRRAQILRERFQTLSAAGFKGGINVLATIGHHCDFDQYTFYGDYYHMTNDMGEECAGSYCMNDDRYLNDYIVPFYQILASTGTEHIWVDDDVRFPHLPIGHGCFCDGCIRTFNEQHGTAYTRDALREALDGGDIELRRKWHAFGAWRIAKILRVIGRAVREVDETIMLGFMTGERHFEGYDFKRWAAALSEDGKYEILWRPGGGAYWDYNFESIMEKSEQTGRQTANLPPYVTGVYYEMENFPYFPVQKTPTSTALESAMVMTAGCTGSALNINPTPETDIIPYLKAVDRWMPFYRLLSEKTAGRQPTGVCAGWRYDDMIAATGPRWSKASGAEFSEFAHEMFYFGLPECYRAEQASVRLMHGREAIGWSDDEIREFLSGGVFLDAAATDYLAGRGFSSLTGAVCGESYKADESIEVYEDHPFNAGFVGEVRTAGFLHRGQATLIEPCTEKTQIVSSLILPGGGKAPCSLTVTENAAGGRIAAGGFDPFRHIGNRYKTTQLKRLFLWLSGYTLPSYVETLCRVRNHSFVDGDRVTVALINPTNEQLTDVRVAIKTEKEQATVWNFDAVPHTLPTEPGEHGYRFVTVPRVPSFEITLIEA